MITQADEERLEKRLSKVFLTKVEAKKKFDQIDKRFEAIDRRFDAVGKRFDSLEASINGIKQSIQLITKALLDHIEESRAWHEKQDAKNQAFLDHLDGYAKRSETYWQEHISLGSKVDRHDRWIGKIAHETQVKLSD